MLLTNVEEVQGNLLGDGGDNWLESAARWIVSREKACEQNNLFLVHLDDGLCDQSVGSEYIWGDRTVYLSRETQRRMSGPPNKKYTRFTKEIVRQERTSRATVLPNVVDHLDNCFPVNKGIACEHRTRIRPTSHQLDKNVLWSMGALVVDGKHSSEDSNTNVHAFTAQKISHLFSDVF